MRGIFRKGESERRRAAACEALEPRLVLAAGPGVGINLDKVTEFGAAWTFKDAFLTARAWNTSAYNTVTGAETYQNGGIAELDAGGWPVRLPTWTNEFGETIQQRLSAVLIGERYPAGVYRAEWRGAADIRLGGSARTLERGVMPDGRNYALLDVPARSGGYAAVNSIVFHIRSMSEADPVRDVHIWMPDYNGQSFVGQVWRPGADFSPFHPAFLERLRPFKTLRFMEWGATGLSTLRTWADRRPVDYSIQNSNLDGKGVALEYMVQLANELDTDVWLCMPHMADDAFIRNYADLVLNTLEPGRKVYVEWSNEVWNSATGFNTFDWVTEELRKPENAGLDRWELVAREVKRDLDIWSSVFGAAGQSSRLVRVVAGQAANPYVAEQVTENIADLGGGFDAVAVTGYLGVLNAHRLNLNSSTTGEQVARYLRERVAGVKNGFRIHKAMANEFAGRFGHDVDLVTYEGGQHADGQGRSVPYQQALYDAQTHTQIYEAYEDMMRAFYDEGGALFMHYSYVTTSNINGSWGALQWMQQPLSNAPKYRAMADAAAGLMYTPEYTIVPVSDAAEEFNRTPATFTITRTGEKTQAQQVSYTLGGTASAADFDPLPGVIAFAAGEVSKTLTLRPVDDTAAEDEEVATITLVPGPGYEVDDLKGAASATLGDNDGATYTDLPLANGSFETGNLSGWTLLPPDNTNKMAVTSDGGEAAPPAPRHGSFYAWAAGADGNAGQGANPAGISQRVDLSAHASRIDAGDTTFEFTGYGTGGGVGSDWASLQVLFLGASGAQIGSTVTSNRADARLTWSLMRAVAAVPAGTRSVELRAMAQRLPNTNITDVGFDDLVARLSSDSAPVVELRASDPSGSEAGPDPVVFTFTRPGSGDLSQPLVVSYTVGGSAVAGADYDAAQLPGTVTIPAGQSSASVTVVPIDDSIHEKTERIELRLSGKAHYFRSPTWTATANVAENDLPVVTVSVSGTAAEADLRTASFSVRRATTVFDSPLTVRYTIGGTAAGGTDYRSLSGTVTIGAGLVSAGVTVTPFDDLEFEPTENVTLTLSPGAAYALGSTTTRTANLTSDDRPQVTITANDPSASEGGDPAQFTVTRLTSLIGSPLTVRYAVGGTATPGTDYAALSGAVTIPAGAASATINLTPFSDGVAEGTETVELRLSFDPSYVPASLAPAVAGIADGDSPAAVQSVTPLPGSAALRVAFTADPGAVLSPGQLTIVPLAGGPGLAAIDVRFDPASNTATYVLPRTVPVGDYNAALRLPVPGGTRDFELFVLFGDVNGDRSVNGTDFSLFASTFGRTGLVPFTSTDFTGDGAVNGSDFSVLAGNFGKSVPPRAAALVTDPAPPAPLESPGSPAVRAEPAPRIVRRRPPPTGGAATSDPGNAR